MAPGMADTATLAAGHAVTVDVNTVIGADNGNYASGSVAAAIERLSSARLTVAPGVTLSARGDITDKWTTTSYNGSLPLLTLEAGAALEFDSPAGFSYAVTPVDSSFKANCRVVANGMAGARCAIRSAVAGGRGRLKRTGGYQALTVELRHCDLSRLGDASNASIEVAISSSVSPQPPIILEDCTLTDCGRIGSTTGLPATSRVELRRVRMRETPGDYAFAFTWTSAQTGGARVVEYCSFDKQVGTNVAVGFYDVVFRQCVLEQLYNISNGYAPAEWSDIFLRKTAALGDPPIVCDFERVYFINDNDGDNPHYLACSSQRDVTLDGYVVESTGLEAALGTKGGDLWLTTGGHSNARNYTLRNALSLAAPGGDCSGIVTVFGGAPNVRVFIEHCTFKGRSDAWLVSVGETGTIETGVIQTFRSNLIYGGGAAGGFMKAVDYGHRGSSSGITTDPMLPAGADYNACHPLPAQTYGAAWFTNEGNGYACAFSATPGAHDVDVLEPEWTGPDFVDESRNLVTFDQAYLGHAAGPAWAAIAAGEVRSHLRPGWYGGAVINYLCTAAHTSASGNEPGKNSGSNWRSYWMYAAIRVVSDSPADPALRITDETLGLVEATYHEALYAWVRAGFVPRNAALKGAAHDGGDVGAMAVLAAEPPAGGAEGPLTLALVLCADGEEE